MSEYEDGRAAAFAEVIEALEAHANEHRAAFRDRFGVSTEMSGLTVAIDIVRKLRSQRGKK